MNCFNTVSKKVRIRKYIELVTYFRFKSHYHTLELDSTASAKDIKAAYYKLSLQYHPDKNQGDEESVAKFRKISEAYEVLSNPDRKKKYDSEYHFQPQYTSRHYQTGNYYKSAYSKKSYSGKTKDFDYDEHFKQHYEKIRKQQEMEFEYFRRRWEADFYRKYPTDHYYRNRDNFSREPFQKSSQLFKNLTLLGLAAMWTLLLLLTYFNDFNNSDRLQGMRRRFYYEVNSQDESDDGDRTIDIQKKEL